MEAVILFFILAMTYAMVIAKRISALIRNFRWQSAFLFLVTLIGAWRAGSVELYFVAALLVLLKVILIPHFLFRIVRRIKVNENLGLFINSQLSLVCALLFTYLSWIFSSLVMPVREIIQSIYLVVAFSVTLMGIFIMIFRMKALTQIIGLLVMENGLFLLASSIFGGMPFFVEIAIFFDVFVSVVILGIFVYRINSLFTHIDVNKLTQLKG